MNLVVLLKLKHGPYHLRQKRFVQAALCIPFGQFPKVKGQSTSWAYEVLRAHQSSSSVSTQTALPQYWSIAKQHFINCRIPYKLGCVITRWNWETVWECAPPFFPGSATRENWASFPIWCQASPSVWMEVLSLHCSHITSKSLSLSERATTVLTSDTWSSGGAHLTL